MANKAISELPQAQNVNNQDLFVLEQSGIAKKLTAETFITEQGIIDALAEALDGHGGIQSVTLSSVSGRIRTYLITFTDGSATTFQVLDGTSITSIQKTSTAGLVDTYTVYMSDGTTSFFQVRNGQDGSATWDQINSKAPIITETVTGAIANFPDGADDIPVTSLVANIEPVQNLNGYSNPWPAGGGGNIYDQTVRRMPISISAGTTLYLRKNDATIAFSVFALDENNNSITLGYLDGTEQVTVTLSANITLISISENSANTLINHGKTLMVSLAPITEVVPYSNVCPITGWTGCNVTRTGINVWDEEWELGSIDNATGAKVNSNNSIRAKNYVPVLPNTNYYAKGFIEGGLGIYKIYFYALDKSVVGSTASPSFTTPSNAHFILFRMYSAYGTTYNHDISINYPATDTAYHAYQGSNTVTLSWQTEAGTVYGGTIDVATGLLTVEWGIVNLGDMNWGGSNGTFNVNLSNVSPSWTREGTTWAKCSCYKVESWDSIDRGTYSDYSIHGLRYNGVTILRVYDSRYSTVSDFKSSVNGEQLCYELGQPQTYQLTGQQLMTLLGTNNVWADIGNVSVTYPADTKMYIQNLTQPTEDDLVANQAITSGKYFMVGNSLYLALANIASGAQITIGTNAQRVSLADALNTINS